MSRLLFSLILSALLGSCDSKGISMKQANNAHVSDVAIERGTPRLNPAPTAGYRIRLKIEDAPGPFEIVRMGGQYDVRNEDQCGKIKPMTGTPGQITTSEAIPFTRVSENEYEGVLYLDRMLDEDYFDRGVCHWELSLAYADVAASDMRQDTVFSIRFNTAEVISGGMKKHYYPGRRYPRIDALGGIPYTGESAPEAYLPDVRLALFSLTISSLGEAE